MWIKIGISDSGNKNKRPYKGQSLLDFIDDYTVMDVETTGRDPGRDRIIQISCLTIRNKKISDHYDTYVNPCIEISPLITNITGITNEMVSNAPTIQEVIPLVREFVSDDVIVGHNVNFDINFIYDASINNNLSPFDNDFIDTLRISRRMFPQWPDHQLKSLVRNFGLSGDIFHNAAEDTTHTYHCYEYMKKLIQDGTTDIQAVLIVPKSQKKSYKSIVPTELNFDPDNPFYNKTVAITGELSGIERSQVFQIIVNLGGKCTESISRKVDYLIVGDYSKSWGVKDNKTSKLKKAEELLLAGYNIQIISEDVFFDILNDYQKTKQ